MCIVKSMADTGTTRRLSVDAFLGFAIFGAFWGAWGASIPRIQRQADLADGQLGLALLFVGAGALPAMLLVGRAIDRFGLRVAAAVLPCMCVAGAGMALTAVDLLTLSVGLGVVGAAGGAADVAINSVAGRAEAVSGGAVITRSHGTFSAFVVLASLGTGLSSAASLPVATPFLAVAGASVLASLQLVRTLPARIANAEPARTPPPVRPGRRGLVPLLLLGVLGALAFASENAHQSWSAFFVHDELHAGTGVAAGAPALFAGVVAVTRFAVSRVPFRRARVLLLAGSAVATAGAVTLAAAANLAVAALGLAGAAAGTAVLFPTLMRIVSHGVDERRRGHATSLVTVVSYLGFLLGPAYVGRWADSAGLRGAMVATAALGAALFALTPPLLRLSGMYRPAAGGERDGLKLEREVSTTA
jgi:MFS family permease